MRNGRNSSQEHQLQEEATHPITSWRKLAASIAGFVLISGIAFAAIHTYIKRSQEPTQVTADTHPEVIKSDSAKQVAAKDSLTHPKPEKPAIHKTFENVAFEQMISEIASYYDLQVKFENNEDKTLRLYYEWNSHSRHREHRKRTEPIRERKHRIAAKRADCEITSLSKVSIIYRL